MLPKIHITIEKWKWSKNYQIYVSNLGNFKDKNKETIKPSVTRGGYLQIPLCNNKQGIIKYIQAHRIVMETWCPRADMWKKKLTVDHLDHNKRHNALTNLEWVTAEENGRRAAADYLYDDKDIIIQRLEDRLQNALDKIAMLENKGTEITIIADNIHKFKGWAAARRWLIKLNPSAAGMTIDTARKRILNAVNQKKLYCGYNWKIEY